MDNGTKDFLKFLDSAHSSYHAVEQLVNMLEEAGYARLLESEPWQLVPGGKIGGKIKYVQQSPHFLVGEGVDQNLALTLPVDFLGRVDPQIVFLHGIAEIGTDAPQNRIDIAGGEVLLDQVLHVHLDVRCADFFQLYDVLLFLQPGEELQGTVVVPFDGSGRESSQLALQFEFLQNFFRKHKKHPFTDVRKRVFL